MRITGIILRGLCNYYQYQIEAPGRYVIFGIRGCLPHTLPANMGCESGSFQQACILKRTPVNYRTCRCTIGIWDLCSDNICVFPGSTLPSLPYLFKNTASLATFNILCSGLYPLTRGIHPRASYGFQKHEALLMDDYGLVKIPGTILQKRSLKFCNRSAEYKVLLAGDNLHAARTEPQITPGKPLNKPGDIKEKYSSSGCITIAGQPEKYAGKNYKNSQSNCWQMFMNSLQANVPNQSDFNFILFKYSDLVSHRSRGYDKSIRYGSKSTEVTEVQQVLANLLEAKTGLPYFGDELSGIFSGETVAAYLRFQRDFTSCNAEPEIDIKRFREQTHHFIIPK